MIHDVDDQNYPIDSQANVSQANNRCFFFHPMDIFDHVKDDLVEAHQMVIDLCEDSLKSLKSSRLAGE